MAELQPMVSTASRKLKPAWMSEVKSQFEKSSLVSSGFFGVVLLCLEKFIEREFACPCNGYWNAMFAAAYFIIPAVVVFLLMMKINGFQCQKCSKETVKTVASIFGPALFWIIIVLWDGQGFACAMTTWSGSYVEIDKAAPQKWCEPANLTSSQEFDYMIETQRWFFVSQVIGMAIIAFFTLVFGVYFIWNNCCGKKVESGEASPPPPEGSHPEQDALSDPSHVDG